MGIIKDWWRRRKNSRQAAGSAATVKKHKYNQVVPRIPDDFRDDDLDRSRLSVGIGLLYGVTQVKIPRNTAIPTKKIVTRVTTMYDNQESMALSLYQGERTKRSDNLLLGKLVFKGIPPALRGVPKITVTLHIDGRNTLHVSAKDKATGREASVSMTLHVPAVTSASEEEEVVRRMVREAEKYKAEDEEYLRKMKVVRDMVEYGIATMIKGDEKLVVVGGGGGGEAGKKVVRAPVVDKAAVGGIEDVVVGLLDEFRDEVKKMGSTYDD